MVGGYDSSQIADLEGLYILNILTRIISPEQLGLYRVDGLIYISQIVMTQSAQAYKRRLSFNWDLILSRNFY